MLSNLPFFPQSFPDETLHSRISRYHLLSGNRSEHATFRDLFDSPPFSLDVVIPKQLGQLVARLPGEREETLQQLVAENTLLALFTPFLGASPAADSGDEGSLSTSLTRIPRRVVGVHGDTKLCIRCTQDDTVKQGLRYWHRAHQVPGVTSCWVHGEKLLRACPDCSRPFSRKLKLLSILWSPCDCGWTPASETRRESGTEQEQSYARFAKDLLHSQLPAIATEKLAACYRRQAMALGYKAGRLVSVASLRCITPALCMSCRSCDPLLSTHARMITRRPRQTGVRCRQISIPPHHSSRRSAKISNAHRSGISNAYTHGGQQHEQR